MKIAVEYNNRRLSGFEYLLCQCPPSEFDSPYRSAVPMLCFCRDPEAALTRVTRTLGLDPPRQLTLSFAYGLVVGKGRGRPARTDLLLIADQYAVAIEAKYTEPADEPVELWLEASAGNRQVLAGWLKLINAKVQAGRLRIDQVLDLPCRMIHCLASACFFERPANILLYQGFDLDQETLDYYQHHLERLLELVQLPPNFRAYLCNRPLRKSRTYHQLENRWRKGERLLSSAMLEGMRQADFIAFGEPQVRRIA